MQPSKGPVDSDRGDAASENLASAVGHSPLHLRYVSADLQVLQHASETPVAELLFDAGAAPVNGSFPGGAVAMTPLEGKSQAELWTSSQPVRYDEARGIRFAANGDVLFGLVSESGVMDGPDFERRVEEIYRSIFAVAESQGYPHLLRMWNYLPAIHLEYQGLENYKRFCRARSLAFQSHYGDFVNHLPSASGIGAHGGAFVVSFIAAREAGIHRENPRQLSAYSYPSQYGPRSPSFARATLKRFGQHEVLFVSGTASIVGHQSLHPGDFGAQLEEALRNVEALIESTHRDEATHFRGLADISHLKVYLRRPADLAAARETIGRRVGTAVETLYLRADVCRRELLVEIEAIIGGH